MRVASFALAFVIGTQSASGGPPDPLRLAETEIVKTLAFGWPTAGITSEPSFGEGWSVILFYASADRRKPLPNGGFAPRWLARRIAGGTRAPQATRWADSRSCPAMAGVLYNIRALPRPESVVRGLEPYLQQESWLPGFPRPGAPNLTRDGTTYTIWSRMVQADGHGGETSVRSNGGGVAKLGQAATTALQPCWSLQQPKADHG